MKSFFCLLFLFFISFSNIFSQVIPVDSTFVENDSVEHDTISIIGVGDMMLGTNYPSTSYLAPNDGKDLLAPLIDILSGADLTFGNSEGTFLNSGGTVKSCKDPAKCYAFRQPTRYAGYLKAAGFDVVSIANNHVGDFGEAGRNSTVKTLDSVGLHYAGLLSCPFDTFTMDSIRYGFVAFSPNTGTNDIRDLITAKKLVAHLDSISDIVIVSFHGGAEGASYTGVPKSKETFYGEDRGNVFEFAHAVIDAGADIVFGHGPHVARALELYNNRIIAYSLGNFCTYSRFNLSGLNGIAPLLNVFVNEEGEFLYGKIYPIKQIGEGGPQIDEDKKIITQLISLTKKDFPETMLEISEDGLIKTKEQE